MIKNFQELLSHAKTLPTKQVAVIFPANEDTFLAVKQARDEGIASFLLVGDERRISEGVRKVGVGGDGISHKYVQNVEDALLQSVTAAREGRADIVMKGSVDTSTMMKALLDQGAGIRTGRILSDIFMFEFPKRVHNKFIMITDGGVTIAPDLKDKLELINNAVEVAHALGNENPKVALLSATEFVHPKLPSTVDAAELTKMNERGEIRGCVVGGPLALDGAISLEAANEKRMSSPVAGRAEILVAPNIETANNLAKSTIYFAGFALGHVIVGGRVPILIPSRADKAEARLHSIALGVIMSEYIRKKHAA
jgi:phosphate butyryltransferase